MSDQGRGGSGVLGISADGAFGPIGGSAGAGVDLGIGEITGGAQISRSRRSSVTNFNVIYSSETGLSEQVDEGFSGFGWSDHGYPTPKVFAEDLFTATNSRAAPPENSAPLSVAQPAPIGLSTQRDPVPAG